MAQICVVLTYICLAFTYLFFHVWPMFLDLKSKGKICIYHINCSVLQVFPALKKSRNSVCVKLVVFFKSLCLISPISCWRITCFLCHFIRLMNKWQSLHHSQSKVVYQNFLGLWLLQTLTNSFCLQWCSKFPRSRRKPKYV